MAAEWKEAAERKGGVEGAKPPDGHAFLQHVATFAVAEKEDRELYKRIVLTFSWRRQMPRLALTLGLEDDMEDIIEELITKGQQLDAVNFAYEAGHLEKFSPVPLLKTYLEDSKKIYCAPDNLSTGSGQSGVAKSRGLALASDLSANDSTADYQSGEKKKRGPSILLDVKPWIDETNLVKLELCESSSWMAFFGPSSCQLDMASRSWYRC